MHGRRHSSVDSQTPVGANCIEAPSAWNGLRRRRKNTTSSVETGAVGGKKRPRPRKQVPVREFSNACTEGEIPKRYVCHLTPQGFPQTERVVSEDGGFRFHGPPLLSTRTSPLAAQDESMSSTLHSAPTGIPIHPDGHIGAPRQGSILRRRASGDSRTAPPNSRRRESENPRTDRTPSAETIPPPLTGEI